MIFTTVFYLFCDLDDGANHGIESIDMAKLAVSEGILQLLPHLFVEMVSLEIRKRKFRKK
ncbi:hypothetical protein ASG65_09550 [Bacillus sp. Leaf13]|nr:hypothetical protein ASG65_09550 [Bacillus sp. Leaf13]